MLQTLRSEAIETSDNLLFENCIWLNSKEAADYLRTTSKQIRNWVYQGKIQTYRLLGRKLLFKKSDLNCLITNNGGYEWQ